ncbi:MAG: shikimate kinase [Chthoniobacterales bacterium]|nr:shikimate kinase [Chthoniobacterales bacterium]
MEESATTMTPKNIILIGFMGSGKTSIGKRLASALNYTYFDTDQLIVERTKMSISELMELQGEAAFRKLEAEVLENFLEKKNCVLSTGGGIVLHPKNQELLQQLGTVIWLHAAPEILFERATRNPHRPLLQVENPRRTFYQLLTARLLLYEGLSHFKIDTTKLSYHQTIEAVIKALELVIHLNS